MQPVLNGQCINFMLKTHSFAVICKKRCACQNHNYLIRSVGVQKPYSSYWMIQDSIQDSIQYTSVFWEGTICESYVWYNALLKGKVKGRRKEEEVEKSGEEATNGKLSISYSLPSLLHWLKDRKRWKSMILINAIVQLAFSLISFQ